MNLPQWRKSFAFVLLLVLLVPILAACGGTGAPATQTAQAPAAAVTTPADTEEAPTTPAADGEAETETTPAEEEATEAPTTDAEEDAAETATTDAAGGEAQGDVEPSPAGNVFRVPFSEPENVDPQKSSFVDEITFIMLNYLPLMTFNTDLEPIPGAAESVEVSEDGQTFTFTLRPDQTYSDGEPLTAENFVYAWQRLCDPTTAGEYVSIAYPVVGCQEYYEAFETGGLTVTDEAQLQALREGVGVTAPDENTVVIQIKEQAPYFLNVTALWVGAPVRQDLIEAGGEQWWADPANYIGNGPFQLVEWEHQSRVRFERNENFVMTDNMPQIEAIEGPIVEEANVTFEAYQSGELDLIGLVAEQLQTVEEDEELRAQLNEQPGSCTSYIGFNTTRAPFDNAEVRQAFAMAFDRETWVRDVLQGAALPARSFIPPGIPGYDEEYEGIPYDPSAGKQQLEAAGFDLNQEITITYASTAIGKARMEFLAGMLQNNLGVKIRLDPIEPVAYTALLKEDPERLPLIFTTGWCADYPDPQNWLSLVFGPGGVGAGRTGYENAEFTELTSRADKMQVDDPERLQLYLQAQKILVEDAPVIFTTHSVSHQLIKPWVQGLNQTPLDYFPGIFDLDSITIVTE